MPYVLVVALLIVLVSALFGTLVVAPSILIVTRFIILVTALLGILVIAPFTLAVVHFTVLVTAPYIFAFRYLSALCLDDLETPRYTSHCAL